MYQFNEESNEPFNFDRFVDEQYGLMEASGDTWDD